MDGQITIKEVKGFIQRRKATFFPIFIFIVLLSVAIALLLPSVYRSQAMILIEEQQIPEEYVKSTITSYAEERLQTVTRQIMSYSQLKAIVQEFGLYPEHVSKGEMGEAVQELKESIELEPISSDIGKRSATVAFKLYYQGRDPETVQKITNALAELYLAEETKAREKLVNVTSEFLQEELEGLKKQIQAHEQRISAFKAEHIGELPENNAANLQTVERLERDLERIESRSRNLQDQLIYLRGQIASVEPLRPVRTADGELTRNPKERLKNLRLSLISMQSRLSEKHPDIRKIKNEIKKLESQVGDSGAATEKILLLESKRTELAALSSKYGEKHPDVKKLQRQVDNLEKEVANLAVERVAVEVSSETPDNPTYINLKSQIVSAETTIANLQRDKSQVQAELELYRAKLGRTPLIEKEYKELTLDYANAKQKYNEILGKLLEANVAKGMEEKHRGERFTITDSANLPTRPYKPNRLAIILLGIVFAAGTALATTAIQEGLDHSIKTEAHLSQLLGVPVLTSISTVVTEEEKRSYRKRRLLTLFAIAGTVAIVLLIVNIIVVPLEELWQVIRSRLVL